jgi:polyhydroxybutyrate depolymerase
MKQILIASCILWQSFIVFSQQTIEGSITHNEIIRDYILYIPASYSGSTSVPLLFNFHGATMSATRQMGMCDFRPVADEAGFIVVHPQGARLDGATHWNVEGLTLGSTSDDVGFTEALLDALSESYNIDSKRVYCTGYSLGGFFSFRLACQLSNRIAAIASVGASTTIETITNCSPKHPTPVMLIHGTNDGSVPYEGNARFVSVDDAIQHWVNYNHCNLVPTIKEIPDINALDYSTVEHIVYAGGDQNVNTEHFKVIGGDHDWPGSTGNMDIDASEEIWKFFSRYDIDGSLWPASLAQMEESTQHLKIYPNPTPSSITIELEWEEDLYYRLSTLSGQAVAAGTIESNQYVIDLTHLSAGMYILRTGNRSYKVFKSL